MKNRNITNMQDLRDLVLDTLGQFAPEHDTEGIAEHLLQISQHDGTHYHGRILDQGDETLIMVDDFWALARRYHHPTVGRPNGAHRGPWYEPAKGVSATPTYPTRTPQARA